MSASSKAATGSGAAVSLVRATTRQEISALAAGSQVCTLGSGANQDVILTDSGVNETHARLYWAHGRLMVEAVASCSVSVNGRLIAAATPVASGDWLSFGRATLQLRITGQATPSPQPAPGRVAEPRIETPRSAESPASVAMRADSGVLTVGRLPDNDLQLASPVISRNHARIVREDAGYFIEDLASTNGTFVDGQRLRERTALRGGEHIQFASHSYLFNDGRLQEIAGANLVSIEARDLERVVEDAATGKTKRLLTDVSVAIQPGEFVVIFGGSGSGKSTLLDALNGRRPPTAGTVAYNGMDLRRSFESFKSTIGYVPQQDIVHRRISIHNALGYTARLRLPDDTSETEIDQNIDRVLNRVGLADKLWQPIDTPAPLSGGQLKRVSLAIELVANPKVLFLDEVTSGLDAGTDEEMMHLFAELASDGKTILCVTHTLENIDVCSKVILLHAGRLVFFGPPGAVTEYFGIKLRKDVYNKVKEQPPEQWADRYKASSFYAEHIARRLAKPVANEARIQMGSPAARKPAASFDFRQVKILTQRYVDLILADRKTLAVLLAMAPGIGIIFGSVFTTGGTFAARVDTENKLIILMTMTMVFCGCFNSCREIVKELPIYLRERAVSLGIGSYLVSKVIPLAGVCLWQCISLLIVMTVLAPIPGNEGARLIPLFMIGMAATMMGLTVSAMVSKPDMALPIALLISFPQIALANALVTLPSGAEALAKISVIAFWGYDCLKTTLAPEVQQLISFDGKPVLPIVGGYRSDLLVLLVFTVVFFVGAAVGLKRRDV